MLIICFFFFQQIFSDLQAQHSEQANQLHETKEKLETTTHALKSTTELLQKIEREKEEQSYLVEKHVLTEKQLLSQAQTLLSIADVATTDANKLHDKISHKRYVKILFLIFISYILQNYI